MKIKIAGFALFCVLLLTGYAGEARQETEKALSPEQQEAYQENARELVSFYTYMMNLLGDPVTSASEKQTIITNSYTKAFRDDKVQVEDDLAASRSVATYKDVQAYLQDIDFFFKQATFEMEVTAIEPLVNDAGELGFKVSAIRKLEAVTSKGDSVSNTRERFIELSLDPESESLRIVSVYTSPINETEELAKWWKNLSYTWQEIFRRKLMLIADTVSDEDLKNMVSIDRLDISDNELISSLAPLSQLSGLRELDLSRTQIHDLSPIRNLTKLEQLRISATLVTSLAPLRYTTGLRSLHADSTLMTDASQLTLFPRLEQLSIAHTALDSLAPLARLSELQDLRVAHTPASQFDFLASLKHLQVLDASHTQLASLEPLTGAKELRILIVDNTQVPSLSPLAGLSNLERVYCDNTGIERKAAETFMNQHEGMLVVSGIKQIETWWNTLVDDWRQVLGQAAGLNGEPGREDLARMVNLTSLQISPDKQLWTLKPLELMHRLNRLEARSQTFYSIEPLRGLTDLYYLDLAHTKIASLEPLNTHTGLRYLDVSYTPITSISPVMDIALDTLIADSTGVTDEMVVAYYERHPDALVIYKTDELQAWWSSLSPAWQTLLKEQKGIPAYGQGGGEEGSPSTAWLHQLLKLKELTIEDQSGLGSLAVLEKMSLLESVTIRRSGLTDLSFAAKLPRLRYLDVSANPLQNLGPLKNAKGLQVLKIASSAVEELEALENHPSLRELDCSGTQIKRIDELENVKTLMRLDISNTRVRKLDDLEKLPELTHLKCFNTRVSTGELEDFKESHPDTEVIYY